MGGNGRNGTKKLFFGVAEDASLADEDFKTIVRYAKLRGPCTRSTAAARAGTVFILTGQLRCSARVCRYGVAMARFLPREMIPSR